MSSGEYGKKWLWRWRKNPLRRHEDVVEAWIVLTVWTAVVLGGTVAGVATARAADEVFARQRAERQSVRVVLLNDVPRPATAFGGSADRRTAPVSWTAPDGSTRTGRTLVNTGLEAGSRIVAWQDGQGRLTPRPTSPTEATVESGFLGAAAAIALAGAVSGAGAAVRWRLDRRRVDQWAREWDLVGPRWDHKTG
ncbi:hypothetical protein [Streptomyces sp. NPDC058964]|uniref:Rv1733c family protein n=1 Tax=Streptomyces sp. NPDC058964 TaxID=3346681 RepID=UPI0036943BC8